MTPNSVVVHLKPLCFDILSYFSLSSLWSQARGLPLQAWHNRCINQMCETTGGDWHYRRSYGSGLIIYFWSIKVFVIIPLSVIVRLVFLLCFSNNQNRHMINVDTISESNFEASRVCESIESRAKHGWLLTLKGIYNFPINTSPMWTCILLILHTYAIGWTGTFDFLCLNWFWTTA